MCVRHVCFVEYLRMYDMVCGVGSVCTLGVLLLIAAQNSFNAFFNY